MKWTNDQLEAIMHENHENILVSAGAGSGKTAILSERVIRKLKDGVNINELLILTFTKAASEEMKDRIRKKIIENQLTSQLNLLDSSYITTFDSFALSIVKKYHYLLNLDKDISLIEESILKIEKSRIIEEVLNKEYKEKNEDFILLVNTLLRKDDRTLKEGIENILNKIELEIDTKNYLNRIKSLDKETRFKEIFNLYCSELFSLKDEVSIRLDNMESLIENENEETYVSKCFDYYSKLISANSYNSIKNALDIDTRLTLPRKDISEDISTLKKEITVIVNKIKDLTIYENEEFIKRNYDNTFNLSLTLIRLVEEIYNRYTNFKFINQMFSFTDIAKLAITIFNDYPSIATEIKESLNEIMIDEYQDTSNMQEVFMSYISNNNLYMVGDIKQSIYRFRHANPDLFKDKYLNYKKHIGGFLIDLNTNFRSRQEVLSNINEIFSQIMEQDLGGANYKKDHIIEYGNKSFLDDNIANQDNNLTIYNYDSETYTGLDTSEIEAFIVANDIKNKIDNHYLVFDSNNGNRLANYGDFTILVDKRSDFSTYKKIFEFFNLPVSLYQNENIVGEDDLYCFNSILILINGYSKNIYDKKFDHAYYSLAKSYLYSLSDNDILKTIVNKDYFNTIIYTSLKPIIDNLDYLSIKDVFNQIVFYTDWYNKLIYKGDAKSSEAKLSYLLSLSTSLDKLGYDLDKVIEYFKIIMEKELEIVIPNDSYNDNSIKFMTIHNSKGLEFPICYFLGFDNSFNLDEIKDSFIVTKNGIILPFIENNIRYHNLEWYKYKKDFLLEEIGEKIRLLYVALTRSKEKMIMLSDLNKDSKNINESNCFNDFLLNIKESMNKYIVNINKEELIINRDYKKYNPKKNIENDIRDFNYLKVENNKELMVNKKISKQLKIEDNNNYMLEKGTYLHNSLLKLDFKNPKFDKMNNDDANIIKKFLNNDFLDINNAINIYKEYEFINESSHGIIDLIVEYNDHYKIIDYKLSNIDDESYVNQLKEYKNYLSNIVNKPIKLYLYSLLKGIYKFID